MGYHIINITHYDKIMAVQGSCRVKERGDVNDIYGGGEVQKVGWRFRELFFSIHCSGFSYEFGTLRYEFGALREAEEICCQAFNGFFFIS